MKRFFNFKTKTLAMAMVFLAGFSEVMLAQKVAIIDAGSSGSRLFVYEVDAKGSHKVNLVYPANKEQKAKSKGRALSTIVNHSDSVRIYLENMTAGHQCDSIDLYILATAGMRLQPKAQADDIYEKLMQQPAINGYYVRGAMTITGQYEGLYGWLAANYDHGKVGINSTATSQSLKFIGEPYGILEIGGASMQLAFTTEEKSEDCLTRPGLNNIYCKSYLGAGVDQVYKRTPKDKKRYRKFDVKLEDVSDQYGDHTTFLGLSIPVNNVLKGMAEQTHKRTFKGKIKAYVKSLKDFEDSMKNYHPRMNSHYIKWVFKELDMKNRISQPDTDSSWTIGAALDIMINKIAPEKFDHHHIK